ncbi:MAG: hypothetical protein MJZ72_09625 [Bacteroidales bacterium]|nr:hypothetical protein [Bacteroidales bacterium]
MPKKKGTVEPSDNFFGSDNKYGLLGVQSGESLFPFLNKLSHFLHQDFHLLGDVKLTDNPDNCRFSLAFCQLKDPCDLTLIVVENKSTLFNSGGYRTSKLEKNLSFHTLSLFDEFRYILNSQGDCLFNWSFADCDYLLLYYAKKEYNLDDFLARLKHIPSTYGFIAEDFFPDMVPKKKKDSRRCFFEDLFCDASIRINQWYENKNHRLLNDCIRIPEANLPEIFKLYSGFTPVFNNEHIKFLEMDSSYE